MAAIRPGSPERRLARFEEVLEIMKTLWTQDRLTYQGRYFYIDDVPGAGVPRQQPYPRILIAANLDPGVLRAANITDISRQIDLYRDALRHMGRQGYVAAWREVFVADIRADAIAIIRSHVEQPNHVSTSWVFVIFRDAGSPMC